MLPVISAVEELEENAIGTEFHECSLHSILSLFVTTIP
jgi:hypothetical protein